VIPDSQYTANERRTEQVLKEINAQVDALVRGLKVDSAGSIKKTKQNLKRVKAMQKEIMASLTQGAFKDEMQKIVDSYSKVPDYVTKAFKGVSIVPEFSTADADMIRIMQNDTLNEVSAMAAQWGAQVNSAIYSGAIAGTSRADLLMQTAQLLVGHTDARGRTMGNYVNTIVNTRVAELDTLMLLRKGDEAGIEHWRYEGTLIKDSRPWCVDHAGKVLTADEIDQWRNAQWAGKKSGDPFVVRGGWNCRHGWSPVI